MQPMKTKGDVISTPKRRKQEGRMQKDKIAEITIRGLHKMTKQEVRQLIRWLNVKSQVLSRLVAKDQLWLINRKQYTSVFRFSLMKK